MTRPISAIALVVAIIAAIFHFAHLAADFEMVLIIGAVVLLAIGNVTGR